MLASASIAVKVIIMDGTEECGSKVGLRLWIGFEMCWGICFCIGV